MRTSGPMSERKQWSPSWAPHVTGSYGEREFDDYGKPLEQRIDLRCSVCQDFHVHHCTTGAVRRRISYYASHHIHGAKK